MFHLRLIINVTEVDSIPTYKFTLLVVDQSYQQTFQAVVLSQLSYSSNDSSILATIISAGKLELLGSFLVWLFH